MKKLRKCVSAVGLFLMFVLAYGCSYGVPEGTDEAAIKEKAQEVIAVVNSMDYDAVYNLLREDMKNNVRSEDFKDSWDNKLTKLGAFKKFGNPVISGEVDMKTGEEFPLVAYKCYYENGSAVITVYFDADMQITAIYLK